MEGSSKIKVAVLGGGISGLAAAWELTRPELGGGYEVVVYEQSWRLGGKGASGRNAREGQRIEEHGLHMWFGFYRNSFRMIAEAYADKKRRPSAITSVDQAFVACEELILWDLDDAGNWKPLVVRMPEWDTGAPWEDLWRLPTFWDLVRRAAELLIGALTKENFVDANGERAPRPNRAIALLKRVARTAARYTGISPGATQWVLNRVLRRLEEALADMLATWGEDRIRHDPQLRLYFAGLDLFKTFLVGAKADNLFTQGLDSINDDDLIEWFRRHGASDITLGGGAFPECTPILRAVYDVAFLFRDGSIMRPSAAAGTAINDLLRLLFTYRGALYYKMTAGMGDAIFAPIYEALKGRGVVFRFNTEVKALHLDDTETYVETIDLMTRATNAEWQNDSWPLEDVGDGIWSWPSEAKAHRLRPQPEQRTLVRGTDFDEVVLAIPVGALGKTNDEAGSASSEEGGIAQDLIDARPRFALMVSSASTVATQAFQVWTEKTSEQLGGPNRDYNVSATLEERLDTYCDMSHVLAREQWTDPPGGLAYVCGVLDDIPGEEPDQAEARVAANMDAYVFGPAGARVWPNGPGQITSWYSRANVARWERYVITPADSVRFRLRVGESGFDNVVLAGDWTRNGIDGGCIEAAVLSGIQAAQVMTGRSSPGYVEDPGDRLLDPPEQRARALPRYIEHGLTTSGGGPFSCTEVKMRCFVLKGSDEQITSLVERTLNRAARGKITYETLLGPYVVLMMGTNRVQGRGVDGYVNETLASFWIPLHASRAGSVDLRWFIPHIVVDNPISLYAGREIYGYAKAMGHFNPANGFDLPPNPKDGLTVDVFGGNFGAKEVADWHRLLTVTPLGKTAGEQPNPDEPEELELAGMLFDLGLHNTITQVFLKQFRDAWDHERACYQAVIESTSRLTKLKAVRPYNPVTEPWEVRIESLKSHPITAEIGVGTQTTRFAYEVEFEFDVLPGLAVAP